MMMADVPLRTIDKNGSIDTEDSLDIASIDPESDAMPSIAATTARSERADMPGYFDERCIKMIAVTTFTGNISMTAIYIMFLRISSTVYPFVHA